MRQISQFGPKLTETIIVIGYVIIGNRLCIVITLCHKCGLIANYSLVTVFMIVRFKPTNYERNTQWSRKSFS